jgi:lipoprotein NlpI
VNSRGDAWCDKEEYDKAIVDFNEAIRLDPKFAFPYNNRGNAWKAKKDYDKALSDYSQAIRLDPEYALAYRNRGGAWKAKRDFGKAIADFNEAIRIDPRSTEAHFDRVVLLFSTRRDGVESDARMVLDLDGWRAHWSQYAMLLLHFNARRAGRNDEATKLLNEAADKCDTATWPYPIVEYLRGEIDEPKLLAASTDRDKMTETRCYLGLDMEAKGRPDEAIAHFKWVKDHGVSTFHEYSMALAELDRLAARTGPTGRK